MGADSLSTSSTLYLIAIRKGRAFDVKMNFKFINLYELNSQSTSFEFEFFLAPGDYTLRSALGFVTGVSWREEPDFSATNQTAQRPTEEFSRIATRIAWSIAIFSVLLLIAIFLKQ